ncbi:unnamed protein product [Brassica oleracea var. botrytis]|uniref:(rape) hypothetical protein n=1 Tax=Brassica napus TaxID=3708 RepID=A0A816KY27_BRANA|nr:unnamed protein product [Brassica napus]
MIKPLCFVLYYCFCHLAVVELDHFVLLKLDSFSTDGKKKSKATRWVSDLSEICWGELKNMAVDM